MESGYQVSSVFFFLYPAELVVVFNSGVLQGQEQCLSRVHCLAPTSFSIIEVDVVFEYLVDMTFDNNSHTTIIYAFLFNLPNA